MFWKVHGIFMFMLGEALHSTGSQKESNYSTVLKIGAYLHLQINSKIVISGTRGTNFDSDA